MGVTTNNRKRVILKKNISPRLQRLFEFADVKTVRGLLGAADRSQLIFNEIVKCYRKPLSLCGFLFLCIQIKKQPCFFSADNPIWVSEGFCELSKKEMRLIELLLEKSGHPMAISTDGILCSSPIERIHPVGDFALKAS